MRTALIILFCLVEFLGCAHGAKSAHRRASLNEALDQDLIYHPMGRATPFAPACFPGQDGKISLQVFEYKTVVDPDLAKPVHLRAYVFRPPNSTSKKPAIALFNGGGWREGSPIAWFPQALYFASRGMVAIAFQYREEFIHGTPTEGHPDIAARATNDARSALIWLRDNSDTLKVDLDRVAVAGDSAGGQMALITSEIESAPGEASEKAGLPLNAKAILALYPVVDAEAFKTPQGQALGATDVSPLQRLSSAHPLPNTQLIFGAADRLPNTPPAKAREFCEKANALATKANVVTTCWVDEIPEVVQPGAAPEFDHGFMINPAPYKRMMITADRFLTEQLGLEGSASGAESRVDSAAPLCISTPVQVEHWNKQFGYAHQGGLW